jgi:hypothetical protein
MTNSARLRHLGLVTCKDAGRNGLLSPYGLLMWSRANQLRAWSMLRDAPNMINVPTSTARVTMSCCSGVIATNPKA